MTSPRHPIAAALLSSVFLPAAAFAQLATPQTTTATNTLDTIVVTGTRVTDRTVAESTSPIDIITPEVLESTGTTELATALSRALPSLNFPRPAITDGTDAVRPAQLRGLAPDQVLVLVNGKRRHTTALINLNGSQGRGSSPVDLNAIPVSAIERVEVLRDGASAQYGSDAIAGVINIVLKGSDGGGSIAGRYGKYSAGDGEQGNLDGDVGFDFGDQGFVRLAAQVSNQHQTDRARPYAVASGGIRVADAPPPGAVVQRYGDPEIDQNAVAINAEFSPAEGVTFYGFGTSSRRDALSNGFFRTARNSRNIPEVYPDGFLPQIRNISKDNALVLGLKGETSGGWAVDLSANYGSNHLSFAVENSLNRSLGPTSPTTFYAGALEVTQNVLNLDVSRAFDVGWLAYPLTFAWGVEWRGEKFNESPGDSSSYADGGLRYPDGSRTPPGAQVFPGFRPSNAGAFDRHSYSAYVDVEADVTDKLSLGLAARGEKYSDFGNTTSGKLSARYALTDAVALRATASTGFRAPSLQQQFFQATSTNFIGGVPFDVRTFKVNDPTAIALGSEPLKAEESTNYSLGLVLQPVTNLYVTVDAYRVEVDKRIILSENLTGTAVTRFLQARGIFGVTGGRYFTNAVDTRTDGIDVIGTYKWALDTGTLDLTAGYNYNKTTIEKIADNPTELTTGGLDLQRIGRVEQGRITKGSPRDKFLLGGVYSTGPWSATATATRYGEFSDLNADPTRDQTFGAQWTLDLSGSYRLDRWTFTVGADNVLNDYPDKVLFANSTNGQLPYSAASPAGFNGAFVYGNVQYKW